MTWWLWSIVANCSITAIEWINTRPGAAGRGWWAAFRYTAPFIFLAQFSLYRSYSSQQWMIAWAVYTLGSSAFRLTALYATDSSSIHSWPRVLLGVAMMIGGSFTIKWGLR